MLKKIKVTEIKNAFQLIGKDWMLITAKNKKDQVNTMTAAWGTLGIMWNKDIVMIAVRPERYTYEFLEDSDYFTLTSFDSEYKEDLRYLGTKSGRDEDKIKNSNINLVENEKLPYFKESRLVLKCKKIFRTEIGKENFIDQDIYKWYEGTDEKIKEHVFYIGEILEVLKRED